MQYKKRMISYLTTICEILYQDIWVIGRGRITVASATTANKGENICDFMSNDSV